MKKDLYAILGKQMMLLNMLVKKALLLAAIFLLFQFQAQGAVFCRRCRFDNDCVYPAFALGRLFLATEDFSYIVFLAVYGADAVLTICHRIMLHENLGEAHRKHAYQLMANELGVPHVWVSLLYMAVQTALSFGLIFVPVNHYVYLAAVIVVLMLGYVLFMRRYYHLHETYLRSLRK